jgi:hypothetical protein
MRATKLLSGQTPNYAGDWHCVIAKHINKSRVSSPFRIKEEDLRGAGARHNELVVLDAPVLQPLLRGIQIIHLECCTQGKSMSARISCGVPILHLISPRWLE